MIGETILHYKILEKLGEGGMGVVYKAHDTTLNRNVALKFLPQYLTSDSNEKERFYHEARAAASLMHQNIAVIYEIGEHNGQVFIAMEYVEGQTLKKIILEKNDTLTINKVLDIAIQICEGLAAAHEKGIVHRDIKSENIMLTSKGRIKLMDFGLAKISGATKLTMDGSTVGTAAYMSPEQALGEEIDNRSDIFSFGIVLYELFTTHLPFDAEHQAALVYSIINEDPQPVARFNKKVSPEIERIVFKALTKDKNERYQHIDDLLADLRKERKNLEYSEAGYIKTSSVQQIVQNQSNILKTGNKSGTFTNKWKVIISASVTVLITLIAISYLFIFNKGSTDNTASTFKKSIAVLPFENLSPDKNNAYFASGTEDMILTKLAGIGGLKVISRTSTDRYKSRPEDLKTIAKQLGVSTVLEGSVQKSDNEVLINVQLIDAKTDSHIWAKAYTRTLDNVFSVEGEVAGKIAQALQIKLIPNEKKILSITPTDNPKAYNLFLQAKYEMYNFSNTGKLPVDAIKLYHEAIAIDSTFALAYAYLSEAEQLWSKLKNNDSLFSESIADANHSIQINPGLADGYLELGNIYRTKWQFEKAKTEYDKALQLSPQNPVILDNVAVVDGIREGLWDDALNYINKAVELDPQNSEIVLDYAAIEFSLRNYSESLKLCDRAFQIEPDNSQILLSKAFFLNTIGRTEQAGSVLDLCRKKHISGMILISYYSLRFWNNYYSHNFKQAFNYADSMRTLADKFYKKSGAVGIKSYVANGMTFCGVADNYLGNNNDKLNNFHKAAVILNSFKNVGSNFDKIEHLVFLAMPQAYLGHKDKAISTMKKVLELEPSAYCYTCHYFHLMLMAQIYSLFGDAVQAVPLLQEVFNARGTARAITGFILKNDPAFNQIRSNPAFRELLSKYSKDY